jgi:Zn-dependent protease with chaperone function
VLVVAFLFQSGPNPPLPLHDAWHTWTDGLHTFPMAHRVLHLANWLVLCGAVVSLVRVTYVFARMRAVVTALERTGPERLPHDDLPVYGLASPRALCFTVGILSPRVYLSSGLVEGLSFQNREAMLAHEAAHIRRRDGLTTAFLVVFYHLFPLPGGRLLCQEWERAAERACDAEAAQRIGDPCDVAAALVEVTRLASQRPLPGAACFGASGEEIEGRVQALLTLDSRKGDNPFAAASLALLTLALLFAMESWVRHLVELVAYH